MATPKREKFINAIFNGRAVKLKIDEETKHEVSCSFVFDYAFPPNLRGQWQVLISKDKLKSTSESKDLFVIAGDLHTSIHYQSTKISDKIPKVVKPKTKKKEN